MKKLNLLFIFLLVASLALTSCRDEKNTGEKIEDGIEEVGNDIEEGAEEVGDEMEEGAEEVEDEIDDATDDN